MTKIVVVDDHVMMRDGIRALLSLHDDIEMVGEASEGKEGIEKVRELGPDLVIMDIAMPGMDGLEATRRLKKKHPKVKVLILTQHDNTEYILSAIKAGAAGYVPKRALGSELVSAIRDVHKKGAYLHPSAATRLIGEYQQQVAAEPYDHLTNREREVLKLVADGHTSRQIAEILFINLKTVQVHRTKMMGKLSLRNGSQLVKYAMRKGLTSIDT